MRFRLIVDGEVHEIEVDRRSRGLIVLVDGARYPASVSPGKGEFRVRIGPTHHRIAIRGAALFVDGMPHEVTTEVEGTGEGDTPGTSTATGPAVLEVRPPMPGRVVKLPIAVGTAVKKGQTLVVLEAMKMQNEIPAPTDAVVKEIRVREGESIPVDRVIAILETRRGSRSSAGAASSPSS